MTSPSNPPTDRDATHAEAGSRIWLSALADGERDALPRGAALWRDDAGARESWHLYHLIGDVLRSDDLASTPRHDASFVVGLRERLAREPVPLAPTPASMAQPLVRRLGWRAPAAVAAGFLAVAAALVLMRSESSGGRGEEGVRLAGDAAAVAGTGVRVVSNPHPSATGALVADGPMIRDARLDAYLQTYRAARGNAVVAQPGGVLRNAEILVTPVAPQVALPVFRTASEPR